MVKFDLPRQVIYIIERIQRSGHRAHVVGGPVRDFLLGKTPHDYDITTDALPEKIKEIFSEYRTVDTGIKHGTVTLVLDRENYEITTYRVDGEYKDSRHPESVFFTTRLEDDLARRDFTMNAIAYNPEEGITDPYGGEGDVREGIICAVGDPRKRFSEDALRILRGIRFSATLGFFLEYETYLAARELAPLLRNVSAERIYTEWYKLLGGKDAYRVLEESGDIISVFLPELADLRLPSFELFGSASPIPRMLSLFYLAQGESAPAAYKGAMTRLRTDARTRDMGTLALTCVGKFDTGAAVGINMLMADFGIEAARMTLETEILLGIRNADSIHIITELIDSRAPYRAEDLDINGNDLIAIGYRGSEIGKEMRRLLSSVIRGELSNSRAALLAEARKLPEN